jgi:hypothetical protein
MYCKNTINKGGYMENVLMEVIGVILIASGGYLMGKKSWIRVGGGIMIVLGTALLFIKCT